MLRVALTGGIGAGKTTALAHFARLGAVVIDADELAREVVSPGSEGLARIVAQFGPGALQADGTLDRDVLAKLVFADPAARIALEAIVHPLIEEREAAVDRAALAVGAAVVVHDVPLLAETGRAGNYDEVVVVHAPLAVRRERTLKRGLSAEQFEARVAVQATDEVRAGIATHFLDDSGNQESLRRQIEVLYRRWTAGHNNDT